MSGMQLHCFALSPHERKLFVCFLVVSLVVKANKMVYFHPWQASCVYPYTVIIGLIHSPLKKSKVLLMCLMLSGCITALLDQWQSAEWAPCRIESSVSDRPSGEQVPNVRVYSKNPSISSIGKRSLILWDIPTGLDCHLGHNRTYRFCDVTKLLFT